MESTICNKNATKPKKLEIKTITDDIRELIKTYHDEKTMYTLKKHIKKEEDLRRWKMIVLKT